MRSMSVCLLEGTLLTLRPCTRLPPRPVRRARLRTTLPATFRTFPASTSTTPAAAIRKPTRTFPAVAMVTPEGFVAPAVNFPARRSGIWFMIKVLLQPYNTRHVSYCPYFILSSFYQVNNDTLLCLCERSSGKKKMFH